MRPANGTVLHLRASNFVGGPERQILRYCTVAAPAGWRQMVAVFTHHGSVNQEGEGWAFLQAARAQGTEAYALSGGGWHDLQAAAELGRLVEQQDVSLICAHGYHADLVGTYVGRRQQVPVAWFLRGWTGENVRIRAYEAVDRALMHRADRIVCLSQQQMISLPKRIPSDRIHVVANAIEARQVNRAEARAALCQRFGWQSEDRLLVGAAGRLSPEKGARYFLQAAAKLQPIRADMCFVVFGDGPLRTELEAERDRLGLRGCLHFAGHMANWTDLLPGLDILVNPSLTEQAPNVVLEAMASGVAVVATDVGSVAEIAGVPASVRLVEAGSAAGLAQAMGELAAESVRRRELAERGRERVRAAYSPQHQRDQLAGLFRELGPQPARGTRSGDETLPLVSVVLPVRHEAHHLALLLEELLGQDYPADRCEVIIADGSADDADDGTRAIGQAYAQRHPGRVRWLPNPGRRASAGRNVGIAAAQGPWIVFVDGHCRLPGVTWLRDCMQAAGETGALCLSRPQPLSASLQPGWQSVIAHVRASRIAHAADSTIYNAAARGWVNPFSSGAAYHRCLFERVGLYDESFDANEDAELNHRLARAGVQAWLCPESVVYYAARASLGGLWRQMVRYGRGRTRFLRRYPEAFSLSQCLPGVWMLWLPASLGIALWGHGLWQWGAIAGLALYSAIVGAFSLALGWRHGWFHLIAAPAAYLTVHGGLGAGAWRELLAPPGTAYRQNSAPRSQT